MPRWKMWVLIAIPFAVFVLVRGVSIWLGKRRYQAGKPPIPWLMHLADTIAVGKADEMERMIRYKASSWAYLAVMIGLLAVNFYEQRRSGTLPLSHGVIVVGLLTQGVASLILRHRATQGDEEYKPYPLWKTFAVVLGLGCACAAVGAAIVIVVLAV